MAYQKVLWPIKWQVVLLVVIAVMIYLVPIRSMNPLVLLGIVIIAYLVYSAILNTWKCSSAENFEEEEKVCTGGCSSNKKLLPIMEPEFNLYECAKQLILLEDHCNNPGKRCEDCIKKHFMTIEALAEEGASLDKKGTCRGECNDLANKIRYVKKEMLSGKDLSEIAQELRQIRKPLMVKYFKAEME